MVIAVALDKDADAARPWIEVANASYPCLIDTKHVVADLYNMVNVPTVLWIDETGTIVRPNDVAYGNNQWLEAHGIDADLHKTALRDWVVNGAVPFTNDRAQALQTLPDMNHQQARAEFALGQWLWETGNQEAANRHFELACELAPQDFNIRRGSMPMRDIDPMGPEFFEMVQAWTGAGNSYYHPLPAE